MTTRRLVLTRSAALVGAASTGLLLPQIARAQANKVRVGLMLPYTGTFAPAGRGHRERRAHGHQRKRRQAGRPRDRVVQGRRRVRAVQGRRERQPPGPARQGRRADRHRALRRADGHPARGARQRRAQPDPQRRRPCRHPRPVRAQRVPHLVHQLAAHAGAGQGHGGQGPQAAVWITWKYAAGDEAFEGFKESYTKAGGTIVKELGLPFPNVEFQALLTEIASLRPDAVACFFAGGGAAKFIRDYAAAGLKDSIPLYGSGFLTEGVLDAAGPAADGIITTMHYSDSLDTPRNKQFRLAYATHLPHAARRVCGAGLRHRPAAGAGRWPRSRATSSNKQALYKAHGNRRHRQPARQVDHEQVAQPGAGHVPARGGEQGEQGDRRRRQGAGRFGRRLQAGA